MNKSISNSDDVIDSRDIIERIEELQAEKEDLEGEELAEWETENGEELKALEELAKEGEDYSSDWPHGAPLIRDSYFEKYAQELAEEIGAIDKSTSWPNNCIDWEQAARELQMDYSCISFDGIDYWIR